MSTDRDAPDVWRYQGKTVVVTGCASGMGQEVAREVAALGARVVGLDLREPSVAVDQYVPIDMTEESSIDAAVAAIDGQIDALFNCAGISGAFPHDQVLAVNFLGTRHLTERLISALRDGGAIASVASTAAVAFEENLPLYRELAQVGTFAAGVEWCNNHSDLVERSPYIVSKSALIVYSMIKSYELAPRGIRVNTIGPGVTDTPFLEATRRKIGIEGLNAIPKPLGRLARPEEMARVLIFLNSDAASYVTGQNLWVDGGFVGAAMSGQIDGSVLGYTPRS